ncbi:uncharacterized protein LOC144904656 [Branchiostoma floridae x Branchiostoma belcheri]
MNSAGLFALAIAALVVMSAQAAPTDLLDDIESEIQELRDVLQKRQGSCVDTRFRFYNTAWMLECENYRHYCGEDHPNARTVTDACPETCGTCGITGSNWKEIAGDTGYRQTVAVDKWRQVAAGDSGVWAVKEDGSIYWRVGTYGAPLEPGRMWKLVPGKLKQISVEKTVVWGVNIHGEIFYRRGVAESNPAGTTWVRVSGNLVYVSVYLNDVWGVNRNGNIYKYVGGRWQNIRGPMLATISAGSAGVWGTTADGDVYFKLVDGWRQVEGSLVQVSVGNGIVWGVNKYGEIYIKTGVQSGSAGSDWERIEQGSLKVVSVGNKSTRPVWGVGTNTRIYMRMGVTPN